MTDETSRCPHFCGCGMPCTETVGDHREVGGELLHACDVHFPHPKHLTVDVSVSFIATPELEALVLADDERGVLQTTMPGNTTYGEAWHWIMGAIDKDPQDMLHYVPMLHEPGEPEIWKRRKSGSAQLSNLAEDDGRVYIVVCPMAGGV